MKFILIDQQGNILNPSADLPEFYVGKELTAQFLARHMEDVPGLYQLANVDLVKNSATGTRQPFIFWSDYIIERRELDVKLSVLATTSDNACDIAQKIIEGIKDIPFVLRNTWIQTQIMDLVDVIYPLNLSDQEGIESEKLDIRKNLHIAKIVVKIAFDTNYYHYNDEISYEENEKWGLQWLLEDDNIDFINAIAARFLGDYFLRKEHDEAQSKK